MKIKTGRLIECFAFLPSLNLSWIRTLKGAIYFLQFGWLYWYIQVQQKNFNKHGFKEKYEQALETVQEILSSGADAIRTKILKLRLQSVFSELKESEDERIRKAIITYIGYGQHCGVSNADMIAWLEKQGKTLDPDKVIEWLDGHVPTKFEDMQNYVQQFKKDFGL